MGAASPGPSRLNPASPRSPQLHNLQRKLSEVEGDFRLREKDLLGSLEEARGNEKKLLDNARNLEIKLDNAQAEASELSLRLSAAEGRVHGLEAELVRVEGLKRDVEFKLGSLHSALRRTMGVSRGGRAPSPAIRGRSSSPKRLFSPPRGNCPGSALPGCKRHWQVEPRLLAA